MQILVIYETFSIYKKCLRHCRMEMKKKEKSQKKVIKDTAKEALRFFFHKFIYDETFFFIYVSEFQ